MSLKATLLFVFLFVQCQIFAQENLKYATIPQQLTENSNAVIRLNQTDIIISSQKSMTIKKQRIVTVLNELGQGYMGASEYISSSEKIKSAEAIIYDASGKEIKKIKKKDFKLESVSDNSVITDNKVFYLDYTPVQYPFTIVYSSETETLNTAFVPSWHPVEGYYISTEASVINIQCPAKLGFRYKEYNLEDTTLAKSVNGDIYSFAIKNIQALKNEDYTPYQKVMPTILFGLQKFHLEGVDGEADSWESFGTWMYNNLLVGTDEISPETQQKIKLLVGNETDALKKAKIIYEFVQNKTRYISIQLGIGGWKPMSAQDVDRLGYGDCKALTNYTMALLKTVGVDSYYTVLYGDTNKRDMRNDFVSMQGNHVILAIPYNNSFIWLECTNQKAPFGFQGNFTDDRMALVVKPQGSALVRTHVYTIKENSQFLKGDYTISATGAIIGGFRIESKGIQYDNRYSLESKSREDLDKYYKASLSTINNLKIKKAELYNNKNTQLFSEDVNVEAEGYCNLNGNRIMFVLNAFNQATNIPQRYRSRNNPFEIARGFYDTDEITISLPEGFTIEALPQNVSLNNKFGEYKTEYITVAVNQILFKRTLLINSGYYDKNSYDEYRQFRESVARNDNAKMVLVKK